MQSRLEYSSKEIFVPGVKFTTRAPINLSRLQIFTDGSTGNYHFIYDNNIIKKDERIGGGAFGDVFIYQSDDKKYRLAVKQYKGDENEQGTVHEKEISKKLNALLPTQLSVTKNILMKHNNISFLVMSLADGDITRLLKNNIVNLLNNKSILHILHSMSVIIVELASMGIYYTDLKPANILYTVTRDNYIQIFLGDIGGLCTAGGYFERTADYANPMSVNNLDPLMCNYLNSTWGLLVIFFESINYYNNCPDKNLLQEFNFEFVKVYQSIANQFNITDIYRFLYVIHLKKNLSTCMKRYTGSNKEMAAIMHKYADLFQFIASDISLATSPENVSRIFGSMLEDDSSRLCADLTVLRYELSNDYFMKVLPQIQSYLTQLSTIQHESILDLKNQLKSVEVSMYVEILNQDNIWNTAIKNLTDCYGHNNNVAIIDRDIRSIFKLRELLERKYDLGEYSKMYSILINL